MFPMLSHDATICHFWHNMSGVSCTAIQHHQLCACMLSHFCGVWLFCDPMNHNLPGSFAHGFLQARILEWVTISSSRGSSHLRDLTHFSYVSCIGRQVLYHQCHLGSPNTGWVSYNLTQFLHHVPRGNVRSHKLRIQSHKTPTTLKFN